MIMRILFLLAGWFIAYSSIADELDREPLKKGVCYPESRVVAYINGVNKPHEQQVAIDAMMLGVTLSQYGTNVKKVHYFHNPSIHVALDVLLEAAQQKVGEVAGSKLDFNNAVSTQFITLGLKWLGVVQHTQKDAEEINHLHARLRIAVEEFIQLPSGIKLVNDFTKEVQTALDASNKVVLVAHSQGNFIANGIFDRVAADNPLWVTKGLSIVNVASPSSRTPSGLHVTNAWDFIRWVPGALPVNLDIEESESDLRDWLGHGFNEIYNNTLLISKEGVPAARYLADLVVQALDQGKDVPRCCFWIRDFDRLDGPRNSEVPIHYRLSSNYDRDIFVEGVRDVNIFFNNGTRSIFPDRPSWEMSMSSQNVASSDWLESFSARVVTAGHALPTHPNSYTITDGFLDHVMFKEPTETYRDGFILASSIVTQESPLRLNITKVEPICIDYADWFDKTLLYDRTDAPTANLYVLLDGNMSHSVNNYLDLTCDPATNTSCPTPIIPVYDNLHMSAELYQAPGEFVVNPRALEIGNETYP